MASVKTMAFVAIILVLQPLTALCNFLSPLLSPVFDDVCKQMKCGKGKCKASQNSTFPFECECDSGWKQTRSDHDDPLNFLPCIVPNCTLNYACTAAPAQVQVKATKTNKSILDPCHWTDCGGGSCNRTSPLTYNCDCAEGYYNLLNVTVFPCYKECSIGMDCSNLGISMFNKSTSPTPALPDNGNSQAGSTPHWNHLWLVVLMMSLAIVQWK